MVRVLRPVPVAPAPLPDPVVRVPALPVRVPPVRELPAPVVDPVETVLLRA